MRRVLFAGTLAGLLACTGCFTGWHGDADLKTPSSTKAVSKAPPAVSVEQITPVNGHQICIALEAELMWEEHQRMLTSR